MRLSLGRCDFAGVMTAAISINNNYYVEKYFPESDKERVLEMVGICKRLWASTLRRSTG